jgi:hypothetical protein
MWVNPLQGALNYQQEHLSHDSFVTVIPLNDNCISVQEDWLKELVAKYLENDDVFHIEFLSTVVFTGLSTIDITAGANKFLHSLGTTRIELLDATKSTVVPPPGPYFASDQCLLEI